MKTVVIDIETTGLVPKDAKYESDYMKFPWILSLAYKVNEEPVKEFIINQEGRIIPPEATKINGITQDMVDASPIRLYGVLQELLKDAVDADYIIGHNIYFDTSIIKAGVLKMWMDDKSFFNAISELLHKDKRIDTMRAGTKLCGKWPKLTELYLKLFQEEFPAHSAGADCEACYKCYVKMVEMGLIKYPVRAGADI
jgi:DNA polymerase-3 subunit alpha